MFFFFFVIAIIIDDIGMLRQHNMIRVVHMDFRISTCDLGVAFSVIEFLPVDALSIEATEGGTIG